MSNGSGRVKRLIAGGVVGLLGLSFAPSVAGAVVSTAAFCANVPAGQSGFTDLAGTTPHTGNIECAKGGGFTSGQTATTYNPTGIVSRAQMASFIANMIDRADALDAPGGTDIPSLPTAAASADAFTDDESAIQHENNINRLKQAGVISGQTATTFNPTGIVSRAQMATFVAEGLRFVRGAALPEGSDVFTDDELSNHEANINRLANADIIAGQTATTYNPGGNVSRAQQASFVVQAAADLHQDGFITPIPGASNQTITVSPSTATDKPLSSVTGTNNEGRNTYTATIPSSISTVNIALFDAENVRFSGNTVTFTPGSVPTTSNGVAIEVVNGTTTGTATVGAPVDTVQVNNVGPVNGSIVFSIDSQMVEEIVPVIYADTVNGGADALDLTAEGAAQEAFGVGGTTRWLPNPAPSSAAPDSGRVVGLNKSTNTIFFDTTNTGQGNFAFQEADVSYVYDANDTFTVEGSATPVALDVFEAQLSRGDGFTVTSYSTNPDATSVFAIDDNGPDAPLVTTAVGTGASSNDVTVTIDAVGVENTFLYGSFIVERAPVTGGTDGLSDGAVGAFAVVGTVVPSAANSNGATVTFADNDLAAGVYRYRARGVIDGDEGPNGTSLNETATAPTADATAPQTLTLGAVADVNDGNDDVDTGDVWRLFYNEPMTVSATASMNISDGTDTATITCGTNATCALNAAAEASSAANTILTVTLTGTPQEPVSGDTITSSGTQPTITARSGITDVAGNAWNLGAGDVLVEHNGPEVFIDTADATETTFTIVFNETVSEASAETVANYSYDFDGAGAGVAAAPVSATLSSDGRTVTLVVATAAAAGATLSNTVVDADAQASTQVGYVLV